jgi:hypothetical protein
MTCVEPHFRKAAFQLRNPIGKQLAFNCQNRNLADDSSVSIASF